MEKRRFPRLAIKNLSVDVSDDVGFFQGFVFDASRFGVCLANLPKRLDCKAKRLTVIISGAGKNFKMTLRPRWSINNATGKSVGAEIMHQPLGWAEFVMAHEPKKHPDVWASVSI